MVQEFDFTQRNTNLDKIFQQLDGKGYFDEIKSKYRDPATVYCYRVLTGQQLACKTIKLAAFRHLNDLKRSTEGNFPYYYDLDKCRNICNFARMCPDVSQNKPIPLMIWQQAILCLSQGWRTKEDKQKRFERCMVSVARTNGKSYLLNILILYAYLVEASDQFNADLCYLAPVDKQSKKSWRYIKQTFNSLQGMPGFSKLIKDQNIAINDDVLKSTKTQNQILRMTAGSAQLDAFHFLFATVDEYGDENFNSDVISKVTSGQVQTSNRQTFFISTAYSNPKVPMYSDVRRLTKVMEKDSNRTEDSTLALIWQQDDQDEVENPETWVKSNPLLDLPAKHDTLLKGLISERDSKLEDGTLNDFINRNLNMWLQTAKDKYLKLEDIQKSVVSDFEIDNQDCYVGFDLSHASDDTAYSFVFPHLNGEQKKYFILQHSFVPLARADNSIIVKEKQDGINYSNAEKLGFCDISQNSYGLIDEDFVGRWFLDFVNDHHLRVKAFIYDPYQASAITDWLDNNMPEVPFITLKQGTVSLSSPTVFLRNQFIAGNIEMLADPILQTCLANAVTVVNPYGIKIDRTALTSKIDCADATIDAMSQALFYFENPNHGLKEDKKNPFNGMSNEEVNEFFTSDRFSF